MLNRIASGIKTTARTAAYTTVTGVALTGAYAAYEFVDGGRDRIEEKFAPVLHRYDTAREYTGEKWDHLGAWLGRQLDRAQDSPEQAVWLLLPLLLSVLYYRARGHKTSDALVATLTRTAPAPVPGEPTALTRAQARATKKQLEEDRAELLARLKALPADLAAAKRALDKAQDETQGAREMLDLCEQVEDEAIAKHARLVRESESADRLLAEIDRELTELSRVV